MGRKRTRVDNIGQIPNHNIAIDFYEKLAKGEFDYSFWKTAIFWQDKKS
ncbi:hypothetical protein Aduo_013057 [Ancylostoma duodenale]